MSLLFFQASVIVREPGDSGAAEFQSAAAIQGEHGPTRVHVVLVLAPRGFAVMSWGDEGKGTFITKSAFLAPADESSWDIAPLLFHALALLIACTKDQPQGGPTEDQRAQQQQALKLLQIAHGRTLSQALSTQQLSGAEGQAQAPGSGSHRVSPAHAAALRLHCALLCSLQGPAAALQYALSVWAPRWTPAGKPGAVPAPPEVALAALAAAVLSGARMRAAGTGQGEAWSHCEQSFTAALALCQASLGAPCHQSFPQAAHPWEQQPGSHTARMLCLEALFRGLQGSGRKEGDPRGQGRVASSPVISKLMRALHMFPDNLSLRSALPAASIPSDTPPLQPLGIA